MAHNNSKNPDSVPIDITDCYDDDTKETRRMMHRTRDLKGQNLQFPANDYVIIDFP